MAKDFMIERRADVLMVHKPGCATTGSTWAVRKDDVRAFLFPAPTDCSVCKPAVVTAA